VFCEGKYKLGKRKQLMASAQEAQVQRRKKLGRDRILGGKMHIGKENNGRRAGNQDSAKEEAWSRPRFVMEN
jgi:hypothetical protein